jgi:hypothetical protein
MWLKRSASTMKTRRRRMSRKLLSHWRPPYRRRYSLEMTQTMKRSLKLLNYPSQHLRRSSMSQHLLSLSFANFPWASFQKKMRKTMMTRLSL